MTGSVYYADRDRRVKELNRARKSSLVDIYQAAGSAMPAETLLRWRKDELRAGILELEFPPIPSYGTPVRVRRECTLPWLRGKTGRVVGRSTTGVKVVLDNAGHSPKLPLTFIPFELEVSR